MNILHRGPQSVTRAGLISFAVWCRPRPVLCVSKTHEGLVCVMLPTAALLSLHLKFGNCSIRNQASLKSEVSSWCPLPWCLGFVFLCSHRSLILR